MLVDLILRVLYGEDILLYYSVNIKNIGPLSYQFECNVDETQLRENKLLYDRVGFSTLKKSFV